MMKKKIPKLVFSDFDGTLTARGGLLDFSLVQVIDLLNSKKLRLHIISGRSVSWGHFLLTHFDLDSCIMEGGGVIITKDENGLMREEYLVSDETLERLESFSKKLLAKFPGLKLTADSFGRKSDRAIELFDLKDDLARTEEIKAYMQEEGVHFSASNVHLNFWCGEISKANAAKAYMDKYHKKVAVEDCLFFGDAPNDQSMFKMFPHSVGVSNIKDVLDQLEHPPAIILKGQYNYGVSGVLSYLTELFGRPEPISTEGNFRYPSGS